MVKKIFYKDKLESTIEWKDGILTHTNHSDHTVTVIEGAESLGEALAFLRIN